MPASAKSKTKPKPAAKAAPDAKGAVPANPGVNPSLTIAALAERAMTFVPPAQPAEPNRLATSDQLTTFHQASR